MKDCVVIHVNKQADVLTKRLVAIPLIGPAAFYRARTVDYNGRLGEREDVEGQKLFLWDNLNFW